MEKWNFPLINFYLNVATAAMFLLTFIAYSTEKKWWEVLIPFLWNETPESLEDKLFGFDDCPDALITANENGKVRTINKATEQLFGWTEKEFVKQGIKTICPDRFWEHHQKGMAAKVGEEMDDQKYYLQAKRKGKDEIPIELLLKKKKLKNGYYYLAIIKDISEQVAKDKKCDTEISVLKIKIDILSTGEDIGNTGSWLWDLVKDEMVVSEGYKVILGIENRSNYIPKEIRSKVWEDDQELVQNALDKAFLGEEYDISFRMIRSSDFKVIFINSKVRPIKNESGHVVFLYGSTRLLQTLNIRDATNNPIAQK